MHSDHFLFVYGTLLSCFDNQCARELRVNSRLIANGCISGRLYDAGDYPVACFIPEKCDNYVYGEIYQLHDINLLSHLDEYEGCSDAFDKPTEYQRIRVPVLYHQKKIECWFYQYNWCVENMIAIHSGDYRVYCETNRIQSYLH